MAPHRTPDTQPIDDGPAGPGATPYVPPRIERLGTLAELTLGGSGPNEDGFGGAGDEGSV